jgi:hypothetical protein
MSEDDIGYEAAYSSLQEEEAHFFWTIQDFEQLVKHYGAKLVVKNMDDIVKTQLLKEIQNEI